MWGRIIMQQSGFSRLKHELRPWEDAMPEFARSAALEAACLTK